MTRMLLMLPNKFEVPPDLALKTSRILLTCFYLAVFLAMLGIFLSFALPIGIRLILFVVLILYSYYLYRNLFSSEITAIHLGMDNAWELSTRKGEQLSVDLYGECIVTYILTWLNFRTGAGEKYHLLLLRDSAEQEALRLLRARLRFI